MTKTSHVRYQFDAVELRIGMTDKAGSGLEQFVENELLGTAAESSEFVHTFLIEPTVAGRYLTLQTVNGEFLSLVDLKVIRDY